MPTPSESAVEIPFAGTCDRETFNRALRLASYPPLLSTVLRITIALVIAGVYVALIVLALRGVNQSAPDLPALAARLFTLPVLLYLILRPFIDPIFVSRKLWEQPATRAPLAGAITHEGVTLHTTGGTRMLEWEKIARAQRAAGPDSDLLVLLAADGTIIPLPRAFFQTGSGWNTALQLAESRTVRIR